MTKLFKQRQRGAAFLVELSLVAIIAAIASGAAIWSTREKVKIQRFEAQGDLMKTLANSVNNYIVTNYTALMNGTAVTGVAVPMAPTVAELRTLSLVPNAFSSTSMFGQSYVISITRTPTGCTPPACDINGLVYLNGGITDPSTGKFESSGLGAAISVIGGDGAYSDDSAPSTLSGYGGAWTSANPLGATTGVLAVRTGYGTGGFAQFTRRDGTMLPTADWNFGNFNINNIGSIQLTTAVVDGAACTTNGAVARDSSYALMSCQSGTWRTQKSRYWKEPAASYAALPASDEIGVVRVTTDTGRAYSWTGATWRALAVDQNGNLSLTGTASVGKAQINDVVTEGAACTPNGLVARDSTGLLLSCQSGVWKVQGSTSILGISTITAKQRYTAKLLRVCTAGGSTYTNYQRWRVDTDAKLYFEYSDYCSYPLGTIVYVQYKGTLSMAENWGYGVSLGFNNYALVSTAGVLEVHTQYSGSYSGANMYPWE